ncbi:MAG TPA: DUF1127 domain-containing protein [Geminicoccaceae bacterium]|nr:DUF1127 domain-containing protein [Geminicoccaceae bacterium]
MNAQLINPWALLALLSAKGAGGRWQRLRGRLAEQLAYRRALAELEQLDDRELADLDLSRADFPMIAREHAARAARVGRAAA